MSAKTDDNPFQDGLTNPATREYHQGSEEGPIPEQS